MDISVKEKKPCVGNAKKRKPSSAEPESGIPSKRRREKNYSEGTGTEETQNPFIFYLPEELLIKIVDFVPMVQWASLETVSRRFREVMHGLWMQTREIRLDELVYDEKKKTADPSGTLDKALRKFLRRAPNIASISGFEEFCNERRRLRLATISLLAKFHHLEAIEFRRHSSNRYVLTAKNMAVFLEKSESRHCLKSFNALAGVSNLREEEERWNRALGGDDNLPTMHLEAFEITTYDLESFHFCRRFDWASLKKLIIDCRNMPVNDLISSLQHCVQIEHLEILLRPHHQQSQAQIFRILAGYEKLSILKIDVSCVNVLPTTYQNAMVSLIQDLGRRGRITSFALSDCTDQIVREIAAHLPFLKSLELYVHKITESSKKLLVTELKRLEKLKLGSGIGVHTVNGKLIRAMVANLNDLKCLYLKRVPWSSRNFKSLAGLRKLKELTIPEDMVNDWLTGDGSNFNSWTRLGFGKHLEVLGLVPDGEASADAMIGWIRHLPRLRRLNLSRVTNGLLRAIADSCPLLRELTLANSPTITRSGIQYLVDRCSHLKVLLFDDGSPEWFPGGLNVGKYRKIKFDQSITSE